MNRIDEPATIPATAIPGSGRGVSRRSMIYHGLAAGAGIATFALSGTALSESETGGHNAHEGHGDNDGAKYRKVIDASLHCINRGETCVAHCIELLGRGDTSLKDCMKSVSGMLAMCAALTRFAALDAPRLKDLAKVCLGVCEDCEKECRKHEKHHSQCKDCAQSCADCAKECKALLDT